MKTINFLIGFFFTQIFPNIFETTIKLGVAIQPLFYSGEF